jgi:hypothetical protein
MPSMLFEHRVLVARPVEEVFAYLSDVTLAGQWRVEAFEPPYRFSFAHVSPAPPISGEYRCTPTGAVESDDIGAVAGTSVRYRLRVALPGAWALAAPHLRRSGRRMIARSFARLRAELEEAPGTARTGRPGVERPV